MRMSRIAAAAVAAVSASVFGFSGAAAVAAPAATVVARVDVDGDGRRDVVTTASATFRGEPATTLAVRTASGRKAAVTIPTPWLYGQSAWLGATDLDGARGAELVLRTGQGAHTQFNAVYAWRGGSLAAQADPSSGSTEWWTDGAMSISKGYTATRYRGAKALVVREYVTDLTASTPRATGTISTYVWREAGWAPVSTVRRSVSPSAPEVGAAYGWHAAGLPRT